MPDILTLTNYLGVSIDLTDTAPTYEQTLTADLPLFSTPAKTPVDPGDYSAGGAGGRLAANMGLFEDNITITCLLSGLSTWWQLYEWGKFDPNAKTLIVGVKSFAVQISRLSGSLRGGKGELIDLNIGLVVCDPW